MKRNVIIIIAILLVLLAVTGWFAFNSSVPNVDEQDEVEYIIGVSQANMRETWRIFLIDEINEEAKKHGNIEVITMDATSSAAKQEEDIDKLLAYGADILIVSPYDSEQMTKKIGEVYQKTPVIVMDRAVEGFDYSLFIGPDNTIIGKQGAETVVDLLTGQRGQVLELQAAGESIQRQARSEGFESVLANYPQVQKTSQSIKTNNKDAAYDAVLARGEAMTEFDVIFAYSDDMALGASEALKDLGLDEPAKIVSCDGFSGENKGLNLVTQGKIAATITCPTGGKEAVQYALSMLGAESGVPKQLILRSHVVTRDNIDAYRVNTEKEAVDDGRELTVGFSQVGTESAWRNANSESIIGAAKEFNIELIFRDADQSQARQIAAMDEFIDLGVDVIVVSPVIDTGWDAVLNRAAAANIPVIMSDRKILGAEEKTATYIGADFLEEGRRAMRWLAKSVPAGTVDKPVRIMELQGTRGASPTEERKAGFAEILAEEPGYAITFSDFGDFTYEGGKALVEEYLAKNQWDIDVIFAHNDDMALGAIDALEAAGLKPGEDTVIISVDGTMPAFEAIVAGKMNCTVECNPLLGPQLMKGIRDMEAGKDPPLRIITEEKIYDQTTAPENIGNRKY